MFSIQSPFKNKWSLSSLRQFTYELHQLLCSGLPLFSALTLLQTHLAHKQERMLAKQLQQMISRGLPFSTAWQTATSESLSTALLTCAEQSGLLIEVLSHIKNYADKQKQLKQLIWQAVRYPIFLFSLTCGLLSFLCSWIIPQFTDLYKNFNVPMPPLTQTILSLCAFVKQDGVYLLGFIFCFIVMHIILHHNERYKKNLQYLQRRFTLYHQTQALRFWHTTSLLLQAGMPFTQALELCAQTIDDFLMKQKIIYLIQQLQHGSSLTAALKNLNGFSPKLIAILSLGEASGQLENALHTYVSQQTESIQLHIQTLNTWLEPLCLCIIGSAIGTILIALYLPIIELGKWV